MDNIDELKKLLGIDEKANDYMISNKRNDEEQYNSFIDHNSAIMVNGTEYVFGVDLAKGKDKTIYRGDV